MKNTRKLLAAILAVAMLFSIAVTAVSAQVASDVAGTKYAQAADVLGALKIMVGDAGTGAFRPDDNLKRSEFAKIAVAALGLGDAALSDTSSTKFSDVAKDSWANGYINLAVNQGIMIGDDNGNFRPDDKITYAEAATVLVRLLGHEPEATSKGGYPTGYLVTAASLGVTKDVAAPSNQAVTRGMIAQMTYNSLTIKLMEQTGFGTNVDYQTVDKTLLKDKLDVENVKGQINATSDSSLNGPSALAKGQVMIGNTIYKTGDLDVSNLLGYNVDAYIYDNTNTGDQTVILARIDDAHNTYMTIDSDNVSSVLTTGETGIKYWVDKTKDTTTQTAYFATNAIMLYNGKYTAWNNALLTPASGDIKLIDTNGTGKYNIVSITAYDNYVVDSTSALSHSVTDKYGKTPSLVLDPDNTNINFTITKDGVAYKFEDLKEWDVLSVTKSLDGKVIHVYVVENKVDGTVSEKTTDTNGEVSVVIGTNEYKVAANYTTDINIDDTGSYYLDRDGKIAAVDSNGTKNGNYAYLVDAATSGNISDTVQFKLFTKEGETKVVDGSDKIKLNGASAVEAKTVLASLKVGGTVKQQLITYQMSSDNKIIEINTAKDDTANFGYDRTNFAENFAGTGVVYSETANKLNGNINVTESTIVFDIPAGKTDPTDFAVRKVDMFVDKSQYNVGVYDITEDLNASAIVVTNSDGNTSAESPISVVDKITSVKNTDNVDVDKLYALQGGKAVSFNATSTGIISNLKQGDVIQYKLNAKGEIDGITVLFTAANKTTQATATPAADEKTIYGTVAKTFAHSINVTVNGANLNNYKTDNVTVYNYDSTKSSNQVTVASATDISKFDSATPKYIFIRTYKDEVKEMVIVE